MKTAFLLLLEEFAGAVLIKTLSTVNGSAQIIILFISSCYPCLPKTNQPGRSAAAYSHYCNVEKAIYVLEIINRVWAAAFAGWARRSSTEYWQPTDFGFSTNDHSRDISHYRRHSKWGSGGLAGYILVSPRPEVVGAAF